MIWYFLFDCSLRSEISLVRFIASPCTTTSAVPMNSISRALQTDLHMMCYAYLMTMNMKNSLFSPWAFLSTFVRTWRRIIYSGSLSCFSSSIWHTFSIFSILFLLISSISLHTHLTPESFFGKGQRCVGNSSSLANAFEFASWKALSRHSEQAWKFDKFLVALLKKEKLSIATNKFFHISLHNPLSIESFFSLSVCPSINVRCRGWYQYCHKSQQLEAGGRNGARMEKKESQTVDSTSISLSAHPNE